MVQHPSIVGPQRRLELALYEELSSSLSQGLTYVKADYMAANFVVYRPAQAPFYASKPYAAIVLRPARSPVTCPCGKSRVPCPVNSESSEQDAYTFCPEGGYRNVLTPFT